MFKENNLENSCLEWFKKIDYEVLHGPDISPNGNNLKRNSYKEVIFEKTLKDAMFMINKGISKEILNEAIHKIKTHNSPSLIENNERFHQLITEGITIERPKDDGSIKTYKLWIFDRKNINNNIFQVVDQLYIVDGDNRKRTDLIIYINGLPIAIFELKNPTSETKTIQDSFNQIETYKNTITSLFNYNQLNIITDGVNAKVGTISSTIKKYMPWRSINDEKNSLNTIHQLKLIIMGIFNKERIIELIHDFILYQPDDFGTKKMIATYKQYFAVKKSIEATQRTMDKKNDQRIGVIWHPPGTGKSIMMAFYTRKLMLELGNPTIVVITDRTGLDNQLFETFNKSERLIREKPKQAENREHLKEILSVSSGGIVFTTIQKFEEDNSILTDRKNVIILVDEAHRSQYGFIGKIKRDNGDIKIKYGYAKYMRDALPNASYIGFTGTPIDIGHRNTKAVFGDYIDFYSISEAIQNGMIVETYYESKIVQIDIPEYEKKVLNDKIEDLIKEYPEEQKEIFKSKNLKLDKIVTANSRIKTVAREMIKHFEKREETIEGKAMAVTISRAAAVKLYEEIIKIRPTWHSEDDSKGKIKVVMSGSSDDPQKFQKHITSESQQRLVEKRLKDSNDSLKIVIVCNMWLTGFDVPALHTIYIDKPLKGHNLMQAISRVNRVYKDKPGGLIVDFIGITTSLQKALVSYTKEDQKMTGINYEELISQLYKEYEFIKNIFSDFDYNNFFTVKDDKKIDIILEAVDYILSTPAIDNKESNEQNFVEHVTLLSRIYALCSTHPKADNISNEIELFKTIKTFIVKSLSDGIHEKEMENRIHDLVSDSIITEGIIDIFQNRKSNVNISILSDRFLKEVKNSKNKNIAVRKLQMTLNSKIRKIKKKNIVKSEKFSKLLDETLISYKKRAIKTKNIIEKLISLAEEINRYENKRNKFGLSEKELAFFDILQDNKLVKKTFKSKELVLITRKLIKIIEEIVTIDWTVRPSIQAKIKVKVNKTLKKLNYPIDSSEEILEKIVEQAKSFDFKKAI